MTARNLTTGGVLKNIGYFSVPYVFSYFLQTLYGLADLFIIGQFDGVESITAVSIGSQVMHMLTVMIVGLAMGPTVVIAKAAGAKLRDKMADAVGGTIILFAALSVVLTLALLLSVDALVAFMATPAPAVSQTAAYLTICFAGVPFITAYNVISAVFRGMGDSKSPMCFIAVACVVNIVLDYVFIGAYDMGAAGAALGTTLSQAVSVLFSLTFVLKRHPVSFGGRRFLKRRAGVLKDILKIGVPVCLQDGFIQIAFIVITIIANLRGLTDAAAVGIVEKIIGILFIIPSSMLSTVSAVCAQSIGAGKRVRALLTLRCASLIAVGFGVLSVAVVQFKADEIVGLFMKDGDAAVVVAGGQYLRGYIWDCIFAGVHFCFSGYFCALGRSEISFLHNFLSIVCVRIPGSYFASKCFADTLFPMGLAAPVGSLFSVVVCFAAYLWLKKSAPAKEKFARAGNF